MQVIELVRELAKVQTDSAIAATLNRIGSHTGPGNNWNETRVKNLRGHHQIAVFVEGTNCPWLTMAQVAQALKVGVGVIRTMIKHRLLPARQITTNAPWMIQKEDLQRSEVQNYIRSARPSPGRPRGDNHQPQLPSL